MTVDAIAPQRTETRWAALAVLFVHLGLFGCDRSDPIVVIQLHPKNPDILFVTTNYYIYKSRDGGQSWAIIS